MTPAPVPLTTPAPTLPTATRVLREQVAALYANIGWSTVADGVLAWTLAGFFYWQTQDAGVLIWLGLHVIQTFRYPLLGAYHRDPDAGERSAFWARRHWRELLYYSSTWGLAPWLFLSPQNLPLTAVLMLVILGLSSTGITAVTPRWPSVLSFVLPMALGLISALAWQGDALYGFLAVAAAVHLAATLYFAHKQHQLLTHALLMRFDNEAMAERLQQQVSLTQRVSDEKSRFFAAANHDLRQPLHAVALFGAVLTKELQGRPELPHAEHLMQAVKAMSESLDSMLDVSRLEAGVVVPENQAMALEPLLQLLNNLFGSRAEEKNLQLRIRSSALWVRSDPRLLQRLLVNLVENALKYTNQGGVLVLARQRGDQVWIEVCDTGIGIAPEHTQAIFEVFFQVDNAGRDRAQGLGLGLSIVRRLTDLLGATLTLRSRPGRGTRFRLSLPLATAELQTQRPNIQPERRALPKCVLVLDDETDVGLAVAALLSSHGVRVELTQNEQQAHAALTVFQAQQMPFDALLCDFRLGAGIDGLEVVQRLQQASDSPLPVLLVTGETSPLRLQRVREAGVAVLFKPVEAEALLQALITLRRTV